MARSSSRGWLTAPPEPFVPPELHGKPVLGTAALYVGSADQGADVVQPLKELGPVVDHIAQMPYTAFQAALDPLAPWGVRSYWRGEYMRELSDGAIDTFLAHAVDLTVLGAPLSQMVIFRIGQGVAAVPDEATAFSHRDARYRTPTTRPICSGSTRTSDPAESRGAALSTAPL